MTDFKTCLARNARILGLALACVSAHAADPVPIKLGDLAQSLNGVASNVMIAQGFDKKNGIAVEYTVYPTLDGLFTAIRGKQVDIGFGGWTAFAQFRSKNLPVTLIYPVGRGVSLDVLVPGGLAGPFARRPQGQEDRLLRGCRRLGDRAAACVNEQVLRIRPCRRLDVAICRPGPAAEPAREGRNRSGAAFRSARGRKRSLRASSDRSATWRRSTRRRSAKTSCGRATPRTTTSSPSIRTR